MQIVFLSFNFYITKLYIILIIVQNCLCNEQSYILIIIKYDKLIIDLHQKINCCTCNCKVIICPIIQYHKQHIN